MLSDVVFFKFNLGCFQVTILNGMGVSGKILDRVSTVVVVDVFCCF